LVQVPSEVVSVLTVVECHNLVLAIVVASKTLASVVSKVLISTWVEGNSLVVLASPWSDDYSNVDSELVASLVGDDMASAVPSSDGSCS